VDMVIEFVLPIEVSRARLMGRQEGRADDRPEVIEKRLNDHQVVEASVMPHYRDQQGLVKEIDANRPIDVIFEDVRALVQSVLN
jgi:UMP-CMP kinase